MNTKQENNETSTTPKEKEKLKQRLQTLFKQQEQKAKQNKPPKSYQKKNLYSKEPQQVNGNPVKTPNKHSSNTEENFNRKGVKNKHIKKINQFLNGPIAPKQGEHKDSLGGPLKNIRKQNKSKKNKKATTTLPSAAALQTEQQKHPKKNKKSKQKATNLRNKAAVAQPPKEIQQPKVPLANDGQEKLNKNQKKKAKKRAAAAAEPASSVKNKSKKPKLEQQKTKNTAKKAKKQNIGPLKKQSTKHGAVDNEFDVSNMSGLVQGGDFDQDSNEGEHYWNQNMPEESDMSDNMESFDQDFEGDYNSEYDGNESGDDPYNYSDLNEEDEYGFEENELDNSLEVGGDDPYNYSDYNDDEEEEENYSDFDEDDYEEDEDSFSYSSDSEFSSDYDGSCDDTRQMYDSDDGGEEDQDYELPEHVPEDLIIHSGTATKRDLLPEDNVKFKDKKYMQVVELEDQATVKVIRQPNEYQREELLKLTFKENHSIITTKQVQENSQAASKIKDDCPKLVPIVDEDGFQLYNPNEEEDQYDIDDESMTEEEEDSFDEYEDDESLGSEYTEIDSADADSLMSEDINDKYLNRGCYDEEDYYSSELENAFLAAQQKVDVIDATNCNYSANDIVKNEDEIVVSDKTPSHTLSKLVNVGSKVSIISTLVTDKNLLKEIPQECSESLSDGESKQSASILAMPNLSEDSADTTMKSEISLCASSKDQSSDESCQQNKESLHQEVAALPKLADSKDNSKQTKQSANRLKTTAQSLAAYNTIFCNAINANLVLVLLKDPFYIYGTTRLTLLAGTVEVYGHFLAKDKEVELFSPRGCSEIEISSKPIPAKEQITKDSVTDILKPFESSFIKSDLEQIANSFDAGKDAILLLKRNEERKKIVQQFKKFMNENVFPNLQNITMDRPLYDSEYLLRCMINVSATEQKSLRLPDQWQRFIVTEKSRVMLVGGKGVGKSTLLRFLINKHMSRYEKMLLIDLDIGQPELFVPQTVSCSFVQKPLLGPGFFLNIQPEKSYAVGNTNIALCPHKYMEAVRSLIRYCLAQEKFGNIPWFVNTMGYNKGFGPELISVIASELPLTDVIQLQSNKSINNFDSLLFPLVVGQIPRNMFVDDIDAATENSKELSYVLHVWQSAVMQESRYQKEWDMSPKDMRYAMLLTRLSEALQGHAEWLSDCKPMSAPLDQLKLINLMDNIPSCSPEELAKAMEANLVYLCHYEDELTSVECLGIGVVRAVDYHVQQLYLLPAMSSPSHLKRVNCLAIGEMPLPNSLFTNQGSRVQKTAPFVYNTLEAKASKAIKQIYHRPKKFLKGQHISLG